MSKNDLVLNKYNINHRSACRLFRVNSFYRNMKEIIVASKAKETLDNLLSLQVRGENALAKIQSLADVPCEDINTLTKAFITSFVAQKVARIESNNFLTAESKQTLIAEWRDKEKTAIRCVRDIQNLVEACQPQAKVFIEDGELVTSLSLKEIADNQSLLEVPEKANEHFELIQAIRTAIANLREFERQEDTRPMNMNTIVNIGEDEVASAWATGHIKRDHRWEHTLHRPREERGIVIGRSE